MSTGTRTRAPRRRVATSLLLGTLCLGGGAYATRQAWDATCLREAYLPDLELQAHNDPTNGPLLAVLAGRHAETGDFPQAAKLLERAIAAGETQSDVWLTWAAALAAANERERSGLVLKLALSKPGSHTAAQEALERCKPLPATATGQELARAIAPEGPSTFVARRTRGSFLNGYARWQAERNPAQSGFATRQAWASETPDNLDRRTLWAEALVRNGRYTDAEKELEVVLKAQPERTDARLLRAEVYRNAGALAKAGLEYTALLKKQPDLLPALLGMGQVSLEKSLYPIALEVFTKATTLAPQSADAWIGLGRAHYNQRLNFGAAVDAFAKARTLAPQRTDYALSNANALRAIFRWAEAEKLLRARLADVSDDAEAHFQLATILLDSNRTPEREAEAEKLLRRSLELEPRAVASMARLGSLLVRKNQAGEAIPLLEAVIADDMYHVAATKDLAQAYRQAGRLQEAKDAQESFAQLTEYMEKRNFIDDQLRREPMRPELHEKMAALLEQGGEKEKAKLHHDAAYMLRKDPKKAERGLSALNQALASTEAVSSPKQTPSPGKIPQ